MYVSFQLLGPKPIDDAISSFSDATLYLFFCFFFLPNDSFFVGKYSFLKNHHAFLIIFRGKYDNFKFKLKTIFIEEAVTEYNGPQFYEKCWHEHRFR